MPLLDVKSEPLLSIEYLWNNGLNGMDLLRKRINITGISTPGESPGLSS